MRCVITRRFGATKTGVGGCLFNGNGSIRVQNLKAQARPYAQVPRESYNVLKYRKRPPASTLTRLLARRVFDFHHALSNCLRPRWWLAACYNLILIQELRACR